MPYVIDRQVVMLAPKERHRVEDLALPKHISSGGLALALGHNPMFDADTLCGMWIGPARDVARGVNSGYAGLEIAIDLHAAIKPQSRVLGQSETRPHAYPDYHEFGIQYAAA